MLFNEVRNKKVSVLIPVYNAEEYLDRCLRSILSQDYPNVEIIAVDDGSKDASPDILDQYARQFPGVVRIEHRPNQGVAAARNRAIELSSGHYLMFVDNDDYLEPHAIRELVSVATEKGADVVCAGYQRPDEAGKIVIRSIPKPGSEWAPYSISAAWAKLFRSEFIKENGFQFLNTNIGEDIYFTFPAVCAANRVEVCEYCVYNWFYNKNSVSNTAHKSSAGLTFSFMLDSVYAELCRIHSVSQPITQYYFIRLIVWFLFYTCKADDMNIVSGNLAELTEWLDQHFSHWRGGFLSGPSIPSGDALSSSLSVKLFARFKSLFIVILKLYKLL